MLVLPTGFGLPPLEYLVALLGGTALIAVLLAAVEPRIDQTVAVALTPWMAVGGALHAFYQLGAYPPLYEPLFGTPAVYVTTFVVTGATWLALATVGIVRGREGAVPRNLGLAGTGVLTVLLVVAVWQGIGLGTLEPVLPAVAVVGALVLTAMTVLAISLWRTPVFVRTRYVGPVVVFAHALDGVSTAIGADVVGVHERTPIPRAIMSFAGELPTADLMGVGWLFIVVKLVVAAVVVVAFNRYVQEEPIEATLVFSVVAAVGLGPATNNLFLFLAGAP